MPRLNIDRQKELGPKRMAFAIKALKEKGVEVKTIKPEFPIGFRLALNVIL